MARNRTFQRVAIAAAAVALAFGFLRLFQLRFEAGDIYPPYSSLRADPLGARALYESLEQLPGLTLERNYQSPEKRLGLSRSTLIIAGEPCSELTSITSMEYRSILAIAAQGTRVVLAMRPNPGRAEEPKDEPADRHAAKPDATPSKDTKDKAAGSKKPAVGLVRTNTLGFAISSATPPAGTVTNRAMRAAGANDEGLPAEIPWRGQQFFADISNTWRVVYRCAERPVIIEKKIGSGCIVISTDCYFLSNEALWRDRSPGVLAWLAGRQPQVVFDESHFGISEEAGVATLVRQYRLHGFVAGLILLALLFVWNRSVSAVPADEEARSEGEARAVSGRDSASGLVNLLRRHVPEGQIVDVCVETWNRTVARAGRDGDVRGKAIPEPDGPKEHGGGDSVQRYREMCRIVKERKTAT